MTGVEEGTGGGQGRVRVRVEEGTATAAARDSGHNDDGRHVRERRADSDGDGGGAGRRRTGGGQVCTRAPMAEGTVAAVAGDDGGGDARRHVRWRLADTAQGSTDGEGRVQRTLLAFLNAGTRDRPAAE